MDITPVNIDYITRSLEDIVKGELSRLSLSLYELKDNDKLCCEDGRFIVAEFGFKGNLNKVIEQMETHIQKLKTDGLTDSDRVPMQQAFMNACEHSQLDKDEYDSRELFKEAMRKGDSDLMCKLFHKTVDMKQSMHDRKECLCYINQ